MSTTTVQMVELVFEENIYASKSLETRLSDISSDRKSITIDGKEQPAFKLRRAHFVDNNGVEHEMITEEELVRAKSLHLFFVEDRGEGA